MVFPPSSDAPSPALASPEDGVRVVDARGLKCPMPVLYAHKALSALAAGQTIRILFTDPTALRDLPSFCSDQGYQIGRSETHGDHHTMEIIKPLT